MDKPIGVQITGSVVEVTDARHTQVAAGESTQGVIGQQAGAANLRGNLRRIGRDKANSYKSWNCGVRVVVFTLRVDACVDCG